MTDNQNSNSTPVLPEGFDDFMAYNKSVLERIGVALRDTESFINPDISIVGRPLSGYSDHSEEIGLLVQSIVESNARLAEIAHEANLQSQLERKENRKFNIVSVAISTVAALSAVATLLLSCIPYI